MMTEDEKPESMERSRNVLATGWTRLTGLMGSQVDGASLAVFRIAFGLVLAYYALSYLWPVDGETILSHFFTEAAFLFPYRGFEWVRPWPEPYLTLHMVVIALAGLGVALGFCYRVSAMVLFLSYTYFFLLDEAHYNNHYYLMSLLAFLLIWMPAQQRFSVHAWWRTRVRRDDHATLVPFWPIVVLRAQLFIIYFFGGVAKFDGDWLKGVTMYPIGLKLREALCNFVPVPDLLGGKEFALFLAWTGLIFDLSIGFLLLWRRTRFLALALTAVFHMTNHFLFPIGVFPFLALAATLVFLEPDWPVRVWNWIRKPRLARPELGWLLGGMIAVPVLGAALGWKQRAASNALPGRPLKFATALVLTWIAAHVLIPLRHYAIPGDANWTEEGHKFSWRMMLRSKHPAHLVFRVVDEEIKVVRTNGETDIDWQLWPAGQPHVLHVAVNSRSIDWSKMPDLSVLYDTSLGERLIFNPYAKGRSAVSAEEYRQRINKVWLKAFGRQPAIHESIDLLEALRLARTNVQQSNFGSPSARAALEKQIEGALKLVPRLHDKESKQNAEIQLADHVHKLLNSEWAAVVRPPLLRMHPFALNGARYPQGRFFVIEDAGLTGSGRSQELSKFAHGAAYPVWLDLARLRPQDWRVLPGSLFCFIDGKPRIVWNYFLELNMRQIQKMATHPSMLQRYAEHVARQWQQETGRTPEVRVLSLVHFNYRKPQMQIDPRVDLAHTTYQLFGHNDWIMPLSGETPELPDSLYAVEQND